MKFAVIAALVAAVASKCEPAKYHTKFFDDEECTKLNEDLTKKYYDIPKSAYKNYEPGCHAIEGTEQSFTLECDDWGSHQTVFSDGKCTDVQQKIEYAWKKCYKAQGQEHWFLVFHE